MGGARNRYCFYPSPPSPTEKGGGCPSPPSTCPSFPSPTPSERSRLEERRGGKEGRRRPPSLLLSEGVGVLLRTGGLLPPVAVVRRREGVGGEARSPSFSPSCPTEKHRRRTLAEGGGEEKKMLTYI